MTNLFAIAFAAITSFAWADNLPTLSTGDAGDREVPVQIGGKKTVVRVRDAQDPFRRVSSPSDGRYNPQRLFSASSPMADKKFELPSNGLAKSDPEFNDRPAFVTSAYSDTSASPVLSGYNSKSDLTTTRAYNRSADGLDQAYITARADAGQDRVASLHHATATEQGRAANIGDKEVSIYADSSADKKFEGPEADALHRHLTKLSNGQMSVTEIPNRPLTIDEVRDLINHGFKPNTDQKPDEPSKPLNDPGYQPLPLREMPANPKTSPVSEDDKNDTIPSPGAMAQPAPENSEPLPQP